MLVIKFSDFEVRESQWEEDIFFLHYFRPENAGKDPGEDALPSPLLWCCHANMAAPMRAKLPRIKEMPLFRFLLSSFLAKHSQRES
jgi:hypothetical protein